MRISVTFPILVFLAAMVFLNTNCGAACFSPATDQARPNIVLIFADDLGYGDVGCFGATDIATPNIDRLAKEGRRFTDFYVAQSVCTASRAALMTGCYPNRVSLSGALNHTSTNGIHPAELLLPEILQQRGYATAIFGKWHLGTASMFHPLKHGFDRFFGIPYSNDNSKYHPVLHSSMPPLPLYENEIVIETDPDQSHVDSLSRPSNSCEKIKNALSSSICRMSCRTYQSSALNPLPENQNEGSMGMSCQNWTGPLVKSFRL